MAKKINTMMKAIIALVILVVAGFMGFVEGFASITAGLITLGTIFVLGGLAGLVFDIIDGKLDSMGNSWWNGVAIASLVTAVSSSITLITNALGA